MDDFAQTYTVYHSYVYRYALALCRNEAVAEDVTSEAFLKALKNIDKFKGECDIKVWLCQIAKNTYFAMRKRSRKFALIDSLEPSLTARDSIDIRLDTLEIHRRLHELNEPYKEVFSLRTFGGLPFADIAELFGKTESWARVTYHRAKLNIREGL
ncbi:MAG: RNA polymerase sigma factor [Oscillospiraceae bacterium]|jgi:RNA polymerase sigma-70 factor (ECF subfamily)|nr:RNA polymerase sigma factor [Oscillospiraceae bacterium]